MNTASLELCKELYELSGQKPGQSWVVTDYDYAKFKEGIFPVHKNEQTDYSVIDWICPAYDLGYLLRKMRTETTVGVRFCRGSDFKLDLKKWYGKWIAYTPTMKQGNYPYADTPEDAAAMLAIQLFKQGLL